MCLEEIRPKENVGYVFYLYGGRGLYVTMQMLVQRGNVLYGFEK